jgi:urease accessory protein
LQSGKHKYSLLIEQQNPLAFGDFLPFNLNVKNTLWRPWIVLAFLTSILVPQAQAHTGGGYTHSFFHGLAHPVNGLDHLCAMIAVGLWAGQLGGRALWIVPAAFVGALAFGGWLGLQGVSFPLVEQGIFASLIVIGLLVALALRLPLWAGTVLIAFFALFHGYAHGAEMPVSTTASFYSLGFMATTALLHGGGLLLAVALQHLARASAVRWIGGVVSCLGVYLIFS